jgi:hypothetical protein
MTVEVEATKDADGAVHIHNLTAHAGYVLKDGAHTEPEEARCEYCRVPISEGHAMDCVRPSAVRQPEDRS